MRALYRSFREFVGGILHRAYYWGFALILDPGDVYGRMAPPTWWRPPSLPDPWPWVILAALVLWCAVLTYHELRIKHGAKPRGIDADMTATELFSYLMEQTKFVEHDEFIDRLEAARDSFADQARMGRLAIWGRRGGAGWGEKPPPLEQISGDFWTLGRLSLNSIHDGLQGRTVHTSNAEFSDIRVNREQASLIWPKASSRKLLWIRLKRRFQRAGWFDNRSQSDTEEKNQP